MNKTQKKQHNKEYWDEQLKMTIGLLIVSLVIVGVMWLININTFEYWYLTTDAQWRIIQPENIDRVFNDKRIVGISSAPLGDGRWQIVYKIRKGYEYIQSELDTFTEIKK